MIEDDIMNEKIKELFEEERVNWRKKVSGPRFLLSLNDVGFLPKGDLFAIKAKPKQGKSQAATILMAAVLGDKTFGISARNSKLKVLYIDTEQMEDNTLIVGHRVFRLNGWAERSNKARFLAYNMRSWEWDCKLPFIEYAVEAYKPDLVIIDGIADLLLNFNDIEKSSLCITKLMQIATKYGCCIGNVLHENKSKEDSNMKGHLGSLLLQKVSEVFEVKKEGSVYTMKQTDCRNKPIEDIQWRLDEDGYITRKEVGNQQVKTEIKEANTAIWRQVFALLNVGIASYNQLSKTYSDIQKCSIPTANRHFKIAVSNGILSKTVDGFYELN